MTKLFITKKYINATVSKQQVAVENILTAISEKIIHFLSHIVITGKSIIFFIVENRIAHAQSF